MFTESLAGGRRRRAVPQQSGINVRCGQRPGEEELDAVDRGGAPATCDGSRACPRSTAPRGPGAARPMAAPPQSPLHPLPACGRALARGTRGERHPDRVLSPGRSERRSSDDRRPRTVCGTRRAAALAHGRGLVVHVGGEMNIDRAPMLRSALHTAITHPGGPGEIVIDLTDLSFCGSAGLNALIHARQTQQRTAGGGCRAAWPTPQCGSTRRRGWGTRGAQWYAVRSLRSSQAGDYM
ncbi:STAS domain-containing protein [Streptomyces erythrochromogenes]|uniref:STAS domain-containing protein n=1 Tax=Streptomyces erythrochromogenes TaxID=285574 RepID=UPI0036948DE2